jgi:hypothetical protein
LEKNQFLKFNQEQNTTLAAALILHVVAFLS